MIDTFLKHYSLGGNWVDLIFFVVVIYFGMTNRGFIDTILEIIGFMLSLLLAYKIYFLFGKLLIYNFALPRGIANAVGFFMAWFFTELILHLVVLLISSRIPEELKKNKLNIGIGYLMGLLQAFVIFLFFISLIFALPVRGQVKKEILDSKTGPLFVGVSQSLQLSVKTIFGDALTETINFLTIKPRSTESVDLGFTVEKSQLTPDGQSEIIMLEKVNEERFRRGLKTLVMDEELRALARSYATEMFTHGFFSHISKVDGTTPAERANSMSIQYLVLGENLAYAPDLYLAHQGLMNSEGHRKNILSEEFGRVGIGVIDGGVYGKMFVQEFKD